VEQTGLVFKLIIVNARAAGTLTITPFIDRVKQTPKTVPIRNTVPDATSLVPPIAVPFGASDTDVVQSHTFEIGRVQSGWKVGVLIETSVACSISHLSLTTTQENQEVAPSEEARSYSRFAL
jgi:hypothetical protein